MEGQASSSGVSQPAELHLAELNQRSASLGSWDVGVCNTVIDEWTYFDKNGQSRKGAAFRCLLVYLGEPGQYVKGEIGMRNQDAQPLVTAKGNFKDSKCFRMLFVKFQTGTAQEYLHAPLKFVVNLKTTKLVPLMSGSQNKVIQPQPCMTLS